MDDGKLAVTSSVKVLRSTKWMHSSPMNQRRFAHASAVLGSKLFVFGGFDPYTCALCSAEMWDGRRWIELRSMHHARTYHAAIAFKGDVWAIGGKGTNTVESYDPHTDKWTLRPSLKCFRKHCRAVVFDGKLHVIGDVPQVEVFDGRGWEEVPEMKLPWESADLTIGVI